MSGKKIGVVRFPGSNCDRDVFTAMAQQGHSPEFLWHRDQFEITKFNALILPGGFSYGDYLRSGALSARSPVMKSVREFALKGGPVLGICNGFQVLTEAGLLPGALVRNQGLRFIDDWVELELVNPTDFWLKEPSQTQFKLPIAHGDGRFFAAADELKKLEDQRQIWLKYKNNPNGSLLDIAGVSNELGNVAGLMPHPERAIFDWMGSTDGRDFLI